MFKKANKSKGAEDPELSGEFGSSSINLDDDLGMLLDGSKDTKSNAKRKKRIKAIQTADSISIIGFSASGKSVYLSMLHYASNRFREHGWRADWAALDKGLTQQHLVEMSRMIRGVNQNGEFIFKDDRQSKINRVFPKGTTGTTELKFLLYKKWGAGNSERCLRVQTMDLPGEAIRRLATSSLGQDDVFSKDWEQVAPLLQRSKAILFFVNCMTFEDIHDSEEVNYLIQHLTSNEGVHPEAVAWVITGVDTLEKADKVAELIAGIKDKYQAAFEHLDAMKIKWDVFPVSSLGPHIARKMKDPPEPGCRRDGHICYKCQELSDERHFDGRRLDVNPDGITAPWDFVFENTRPWYEKSRSRALVSEVTFKILKNPLVLSLLVLGTLYGVFGIPGLKSYQAEQLLRAHAGDKALLQGILAEETAAEYLEQYRRLSAARARFAAPAVVDLYALGKQGAVEQVWESGPLAQFELLAEFAEGLVDDRQARPEMALYALEDEHDFTLADWVPTRGDLMDRDLNRYLELLAGSLDLITLRQNLEDILSLINRNATHFDAVQSTPRLINAWITRHDALLAEYERTLASFENDPCKERGGELAELAGQVPSHKDLLESSEMALFETVERGTFQAKLDARRVDALADRIAVLTQLSNFAVEAARGDREVKEVVASQAADFVASNRGRMPREMEMRVRAWIRGLMEFEVPPVIEIAGEEYQRFIERIEEFRALSSQPLGESQLRLVAERQQRTKATLGNKLQAEIELVNNTAQSFLRNNYRSAEPRLVSEWNLQIEQFRTLKDKVIELINANLGYTEMGRQLLGGLDDALTVIGLRVQVMENLMTVAADVEWNAQTEANPDVFRQALSGINNAIGVCRRVQRTYPDTAFSADAESAIAAHNKRRLELESQARYAAIPRAKLMVNVPPADLLNFVSQYRHYIDDERNRPMVAIAGVELLEVLKKLPDQPEEDERIIDELEHLVQLRPPEVLTKAMNDFILDVYLARVDDAERLKSRAEALRRKVDMAKAMQLEVKVEALDIARLFNPVEQGQITFVFLQDYRGAPAEVSRYRLEVGRGNRTRSGGGAEMQVDLSLPLQVRAIVSKGGRERQGVAEIDVAGVSGVTDRIARFTDLGGALFKVTLEPRD